MLGSAAAGVLGMLPEAQALCDNGRQQTSPQVLPALQGKGLERKEASRLT